jgi:GNAT superfamily N-acetyltransferase
MPDVATIRPARPADESTLLGMLPLLAEFPVPFWRTAQQIADADLRILLHALHHPEPGNSVLVAEEPPDTIAGFVFAVTRQDYFTGRPQVHIEVLIVLDAARGRGIARALIGAVEEWARSRGNANVTLNVFANNARARSIYERLGYRPETVHYIKPLDAGPAADEGGA